MASARAAGDALGLHPVRLQPRDDDCEIEEPVPDGEWVPLGDNVTVGADVPWPWFHELGPIPCTRLQHAMFTHNDALRDDLLNAGSDPRLGLEWYRDGPTIFRSNKPHTPLHTAAHDDRYACGPDGPDGSPCITASPIELAVLAGSASATTAILRAGRDRRSPTSQRALAKAFEEALLSVRRRCDDGALCGGSHDEQRLLRARLDEVAAVLATEAGGLAD